MKKWIVVIVLIAGVFILAPRIKGYYFSKPVDSPIKTDLSKDLGSKKTTPNQGFGKYLKSARVGYRSTFVQDSKIPKECLDYFDALQKIDFLSASNQAEQMTYQLLPEQPENCKGEFITGFTAVQQDYLKKCKPKDQNLSEKISEECGSAVFMLRAAVTRLALKDKPLKEITDMSQLTDLVFSELAGVFSDGKRGAKFTNMKAIAERMIELDPNLFVAHKINVMSNMVEGIMASENKQDATEIWKRSAEALEKARELQPHDETLDDAEIAIKTKGMDPATTLDLGQKMTEQNPESDRGWFLLSYAQWKQGDHASSIYNLKRAITLAPGNQDYQKTLQDITKPGANGESFKAAFKISIGSDDFNH